MGATELEKGPASQTKLDVLPGFRNTVLRTKQVIIGCGGGFHQEWTQPYRPVARWMSDVDVALNDEGQQYGNLDEASAIARVPRKGLVVWCGDHKQTPGGLRKSDEARAFRRKLMRRPIAFFFSGVNWVFQRKPLLMATNLFDLFKPLSFPVSHAHFWLRHRCFLRVSPKPSSSVASSHSGIGAFLWISPEPSSLRPLRLCLLFCVWNLLVPVAFCMLLYTRDV